jgi:hypothetical protein
MAASLIRASQRKGVKVRYLFLTRRRIATFGAIVTLVLAGGGAAFAYFTSTGTGTGSATVGRAGAWTVKQDTTTGVVYPGSGTAVITFDVTNSGHGKQQYSSAAAAIVPDGSPTPNVEQSGSPQAGCQAGWFTPTVTSDPGINTEIASGATVQVQVSVTMIDTNSSQDACQGVLPDVSLTIS